MMKEYIFVDYGHLGSGSQTCMHLGWGVVENACKKLYKKCGKVEIE
jgi:hypothetical protein